ncbi:MAG TPA: hypothetical protein VMG30_17060 [Acidobacteriota bacterium]|nr:hypothetical protein [Acidobacteriota bacterium]
MSNQRIFTDQELKEMGTRTLDLVLEAIDAGNKEKAKDLASRMYQEFNYLHDGYGFWVTGLQTYIYKNYGIDALEEAEREAHTIEAKVVFKPIEAKDLRSQVEQLAKGLRGHLQPIAIEENDEMITLTMQPCGSGERIIQKGGYEAGLGKVDEPHRITWGMKDFPIYCVHCPIMEALDIENTGNFRVVHIVTEPMYHGACKFAFYKNPADIPEEYFTRIGKKKPVAGKN